MTKRSGIIINWIDIGIDSLILKSGGPLGIDRRWQLIESRSLLPRGDEGNDGDGFVGRELIKCRRPTSERVELMAGLALPKPICSDWPTSQPRARTQEEKNWTGNPAEFLQLSAQAPTLTSPVYI